MILMRILLRVLSGVGLDLYLYRVIQTLPLPHKTLIMLANLGKNLD